MSNPLKQLDDLPMELWFKILELCEIKDLLVCRLVAKKWKRAVSQIKVDELVYQINEEAVKDNWFYTNKPVKNVIEISLESLFSSDPTYNLLKSSILNLKFLKRLRIDYPIVERKFNFGIVNNFVHLEQLEIKPKHFYGEYKLTLPNLRIFYFYNSKGRETLQIDAPKLEIIKCCDDLSAIKVKQEETVKHLEVCYFEDYIRQFKNVECLKIRQSYANYGVDLEEDFLKDLVKVKEIRLEYNYSEYFSPDFENIRENLINLFNQKVKLRKGVNIYFANVLVTDIEQVRNFKENEFIAKIVG